VGTKEGHGLPVGYLALFSEIGLVLFVTTLGGALAGRWLDDQLGTEPWLLVSGFVLGIALGAMADWRLISRFLENLKDS
jgi:F0F1-type ATP synthase assembly protein I